MRYLRTFLLAFDRVTDDVKSWYNGRGPEGAVLEAIGEDVVDVPTIRERLRGVRGLNLSHNDIEAALLRLAETQADPVHPNLSIIGAAPDRPCVLDLLRNAGVSAEVDGYVGDRGSYVHFKAPVTEARAAALEAGRRWAECDANYAQSIPRHHTATNYHASHHRFTFEGKQHEPFIQIGELTLTLEGGVPESLVRSDLHLHCTGGWADIRLPWRISCVEYGGFSTSQPDGFAEALNKARKLAEFLEALRPAGA